jgi:hypothetical protein
MVSVKVNEAPLEAGPVVTLTDAPVVEPLIVPLPTIVQLWVTVPPAGRTVDV